MSETQEWIKEQYAKEHVPSVTVHTLQREIEMLEQRLRVVEEELAWRQKEAT